MTITRWKNRIQWGSNVNVVNADFRFASSLFLFCHLLFLHIIIVILINHSPPALVLPLGAEALLRAAVSIRRLHYLTQSLGWA